MEDLFIARHAHMHTRPTLGVNNHLAEELEINFTSATAPTFEIDDALPAGS